MKAILKWKQQQQHQDEEKVRKLAIVLLLVKLLCSFNYLVILVRVLRPIQICNFPVFTHR